MQIILLTGATSGIGLELLKFLILRPVYVIAVCRTVDTAELLKGMFTEVATLETVVCDLSNMSCVDSMCQDISSRYDKIDVCIFNAACIMPAYVKTIDGVETQLAVNHLSSYLICNKLVLQLKSAHCIFVTSRAYAIAGRHFKMILDENTFYHPTIAYAQSKLMNIVFTQLWPSKFPYNHFKVTLVHPGTVNTLIGNKHATWFQSVLWNVMKFTARKPVDAATDIYNLIINPPQDTDSGVWYKGKLYPFKDVVTDKAVIARVEQISQTLLSNFL